MTRVDCFDSHRLACSYHYRRRSTVLRQLPIRRTVNGTADVASFQSAGASAQIGDGTGIFTNGVDERHFAERRHPHQPGSFR